MTQNRKLQNLLDQSMRTLPRLRHAQELQSRLHFRNSVFGIDLARSLLEVPLTALVSPRGRGKWQAWVFPAHRERNMQDSRVFQLRQFSQVI
jgi:hypothetical protein